MHSNTKRSILGIFRESSIQSRRAEDLPDLGHPWHRPVRAVEDRPLQELPAISAGRSGGENPGAGAAVDAGVPRAARHPDAAGQFWRGAREPARAGPGPDEGLGHAVSRRQEPRGGHPGDPQQGSPVRNRADPARLRRQRRLGDVPLVRGSEAGHSRRVTATAKVLPGVIQARAAGRLLNRPRASRLRVSGASQRSRPHEVPASSKELSDPLSRSGTHSICLFCRVSECC